MCLPKGDREIDSAHSHSYMEAKTIDLTGVGRGIEVPGVQKGKEERVDTRLDVETGMGSTVVPQSDCSQ